MRLRISMMALAAASVLAVASGSVFAQDAPADPTKTGNGSGMHGVGAGADPKAMPDAGTAMPADGTPMAGGAMMKKPMMKKHMMKKHMMKKHMMKKKAM